MKQTLLYAMPLIFTGVLFLWTWIVSPYSEYGDNWAVIPAVVLFFAVIGWHVALIITQEQKSILAVYAVLHVGLLFYPWIYCLTSISKDSL
jgi:hypothetical protein